MRIKGNVFIVTGAGSGLGKATALALSKEGARLVLADLDATRGEATEQECTGEAIFQKTDVTQENDAIAAISLAVERFGGVNGLVNCAGIAPGERIVGRKGPHGLDSFRRAIEINLIGTFNMMRLAAEAMGQGEPDAEGERGIVINTASIAAFDGQIGQAAYAASKGGVASLTLPAARELARLGVRVVTIAPGVFETPMMQAMTPEIKSSLGAAVPFPPRLGRPEEYAALALHIIGNTMVNGEVIRIDGALRMGA